MENKEDPLEGSSKLFTSVMGSISEEQWEEYQRMRKLESSYFFDEESDLSDMEDEETVPNVEVMEDSEIGSKSLKRKKKEEDEIEEEDEEEEYDDDDDEDYIPEKKEVEEDKKLSQSLHWNSTDAFKYVNGEISFSEFVDKMDCATEIRAKKRFADGTGKEKKSPLKPIPIKPSLKKTRRKVSDLPKELASQMGMANLCFANGDKEKAIEICLELIKLAPSARDPFQTLGLIFEDKGDEKKALQYFLIAACLDRSNTEEWVRLAGLSYEQNQIPQAIQCFTFAIKNEPKDVHLLWERCNLYEMIGDKKNALAGYEQILAVLDRPEDGEQCVVISREIAKVHHQNEDLINSIKVLEVAFSKFPTLITSEDLNFLLELQLTKKQYKAALKNFVRHCNVKLNDTEAKVLTVEEIEEYTDEQFPNIDKCIIPDELHVDLQMKLLICLIHLRAMKSTESMITSLMQENVEELGDLYIDIVEALMEVKEYCKATSLLKLLISSNKFNIAAVWLKYGNCLNAVTQGKDVTEAYETVLKLDPSFFEARIALSKFLVQEGKVEDAAEVLKQEYEKGKLDALIDIDVLTQRCNLLYELGDYQEFIKAARLAQYSHCFQIREDQEFLFIISNQSFKRRIEVLKDTPSIVNRPKPLFRVPPNSFEVMWSIHCKLVEKMFELKMFEDLQTVCFEAMSSSLWKKNKKLSQDVETMTLFSCYFNKNYKFNFLMVRDKISREKNFQNNRLWNLLGLNINLSLQIRHNRFCLRSLMKHPDNLALGLFNGFCAMNSGSYRDALGMYVTQLRKYPNNPFLLFLVGVTYTHMACQKFTTKRQIIVSQAFLFLKKYMTFRNFNQESLYNVARSLHQLGIKDAAAFYYKKALETPCVVCDPAEKEVFDLKHEIAYNLALIYEAAGSSDLASYYLRKYNVV